MKLINQSKADTCLACVLAMMVNEDEDYVLDWFDTFGHPYTDEDAFIFLAHHGIYLAICVDFTQQTIGGKGVKMHEKQEFNIEFSLEKHKAYMVVDSQLPEITHAVFWDGKHILDPLYDKPQEIKNYKVQHIYPLMTTKQREEIKR